jgi:hypothetical protein
LREVTWRSTEFASLISAKETNAIIVHNVTVEQCIKMLKTSGYRVTYEGYGGITTIKKRMENHGELEIFVDIKDSSAIITGLFEGKIMTPELFKFKESYGGHDISSSFNFLIDFAKSLGGSIEYLKK